MVVWNRLAFNGLNRFQHPVPLTVLQDDKLNVWVLQVNLAAELGPAKVLDHLAVTLVEGAVVDALESDLEACVEVWLEELTLLLELCMEVLVIGRLSVQLAYGAEASAVMLHWRGVAQSKLKGEGKACARR